MLLQMLRELAVVVVVVVNCGGVWTKRGTAGRGRSCTTLLQTIVKRRGEETYYSARGDGEGREPHIAAEAYARRTGLRFCSSGLCCRRESAESSAVQPMADVMTAQSRLQVEAREGKTTLVYLPQPA